MEEKVIFKTPNFGWGSLIVHGEIREIKKGTYSNNICITIYDINGKDSLGVCMDVKSIHGHIEDILHVIRYLEEAMKK